MDSVHQQRAVRVNTRQLVRRQRSAAHTLGICVALIAIWSSVSEVWIVAYPDTTAFLGDYFRFAGDPDGTPNSPSRRSIRASAI